MSSVVGHVEQFVAGLILLTIVNIYKGNFQGRFIEILIMDKYKSK